MNLLRRKLLLNSRKNLKSNIERLTKSCEIHIVQQFGRHAALSFGKDRLAQPVEQLTFNQ